MDVRAAIAGLTADDYAKLRGYACRRMRRAPAHLDADDLLSEAIVQTLEGRRTWNAADVDMKGHLYGVMRSLASHADVALETRLRDYLPDHVEPVDTAVNVQQRLEDTEELRAVTARFAHDAQIVSVIDGMAAGRKGPEIKATLGLTQRGLETIMKRMRRTARKESERDMEAIEVDTLAPKQREAWEKVRRFIGENPGASIDHAAAETGVNAANYYAAKKRLGSVLSAIKAAPAPTPATPPAPAMPRPAEPAQALSAAVEILAPFDAATRARIVGAVTAFYGLKAEIA